MKKIYDLAIIGGGAAGIFTAINSPKSFKTILLEKTKMIGTKVLLSGGERCNVSNISINPLEDYFGKNKKSLLSLFKKFSNYDMISWLEERGVKTEIEDRGRIILASGKSKELLEILQKELDKNKVEIKTHFDVKNISKESEIFEIKNSEEEIIYAKNVVVSSGGKSFAQIGTSGEGYNFAKSFGIEVVNPYKGLCGIVTKDDLKEISGTTVFLEFQIFHKEELIYTEFGSFLFTHFGVSGPLVFNGVLRIGEFLRELNISEDEELNYLKDNFSIILKFTEEAKTKNILKRFSELKEFDEVKLSVNDMRGWAEAKVTGGGILVDELSNIFESKKVPGLFFVGEVLDITGKTGGFNLQSAWSQGFVVGRSFEKN